MISFQGQMILFRERFLVSQLGWFDVDAFNLHFPHPQNMGEKPEEWWELGSTSRTGTDADECLRCLKGLDGRLLKGLSRWRKTEEIKVVLSFTFHTFLAYTILLEIIGASNIFIKNA